MGLRITGVGKISACFLVSKYFKTVRFLMFSLDMRDQAFPEAQFQSI